ncbi:phosphoglycerate mutase-like protein [Punctularia strigosozonata HHB-11173 SS5]|uniref:Phosphoglycerate mutase-like protein n=1 Tax=Punctularia strigosozonata (strain HHB-11173) TaxID=741275 RepID=R7S583_PUNST|nr:phosphoglycerate mutase-like protein [Punctularia strigosozonata HHB-11173 SS5]EIN05099.1 phosphoglycerate mutase-like protein [Punctularia strigosozonata HHB-11173 SS5]
MSQVNLRVAAQVNGTTGVYNSSVTPSSLPWNTYNYCNAPHVKVAHYSEPKTGDAELVYMNVMFRHHKARPSRTPDNLYPNENVLNPFSGWDCSDFIQLNYASGTAVVFHETVIPADHPFLSQIWNGTCDAGQFTAGGLADAVKHGQDFWSVYSHKLGFLKTVNQKDMYIRTSTEDRTQQVASGLLFGMDPNIVKSSKKWPLRTQPSNIDSLVPSYSCPAADAIRDAYQSVPAWTDHLVANQDLADRLGNMLGTANMSAWTSWYDHYFDTFTSRTCHGHSLPCNTSGACVSQTDADRVYALGDLEYNYIWNAAENATTYNQLTFGVMFSELAANFRSFKSGSETYKSRLYVGHDGSMIRLASGLGLGKLAPLRWPALGSEIVMEVWKTSADGLRVRVMHEGTPVSSLTWVPLDDFINLLEAQVPSNIFGICNA